MLTTVKARNRYPIAFAILGSGLYLQFTVHNLEPIYTILYTMAAGLFAWEIMLGVAVGVAIFAGFKFLASLPLGITIVVVGLLALFFGV